MTPEEKARAYDKTISKLQSLIANANKQGHIIVRVEDIENTFPELKESEDEKIRKAIVKFFELQDDNTTYSFIPKKDILAWLEKQGKTFTKKDVDDAYLKGVSDTKNEFEKQGEKPQAKSALETWKIMRFEVYQQASGNRHEPNCSDDTTKMFSLNDIDEIFERIAETCEEQGEQKPILDFKAKDWYVSEADGKIRNIYHLVDEPKFHEGDWIVKKGTIYRIDKISGVYITLSTIDGTALVYHKSVLCSERIHLWTIEDAKDGDVLFMDNGASNCVFIYKSFNNGIINKYTSYNDFGFEGDHYLVLNNGYIIPATKEQRDLLFQKMKEASYEWDADKKELKKIEDEPENYKKQVMSEITDLVEDYIKQKPTWSEEDEKRLNSCLNILQPKTLAGNTETTNTKWLKSLKERIGG